VSDPPSRGVFLSYRREDAAPYARLLQFLLRERLPGTPIFMDLDSIEAGLDFAEVISEAVSSCAVLVALIGRQWATLTDEEGRQRLDDPDDYVRFEIRTALERGVRVIPVLVDGATALRRQQLPSELHKLARLNAFELSYRRFEYDADQLLDLILRVLAAGQRRDQIEHVQRQTRDDAAAQDRSADLAVSDQLATLGPPTADVLAAPSGEQRTRFQEADPGASLRGQRRYPWDKWTDGSTWEIRRGQDYDVATENMRVNLHMRASSMGCKVRTRKLKDDHREEGLAFQFFGIEPSREMSGRSDDPDALIELLYQDAAEIYERARREVTIPRKDGRTQKYAANRYKQQIDKAHAEHRLVAAISQIVSRPTQGFGHLENAGRDDLMVETLVLDASKPYHQLFPAATVEMARERMAQYRARHPRPLT